VRLEQLIDGNDEVQQHVAAERRKQGLTAVSPMARRAIEKEILPQIEESVISAESAEDLCASTKRSIEAAFSYKNEIYTRLVSYKGIDQSDQQFLADLVIVMDEWLRGVKAALERKEEEEEVEEEPEKREVEVTVKVETEASKEREGVVVKDVEGGAEIDERDPSAVFDLRDVRL